MSRKTPRQQPMAAEPAGAPFRDGTPIQLKDYQHHGSIYGVVPAKTGHLRPAGQWNDEEIMCRGRHVTVTLNGQVIHEDVELKWPTGHAWRTKKEVPRGPLFLQGDHGPVAYRNVRVRPK